MARCRASLVVLLATLCSSGTAQPAVGQQPGGSGRFQEVGFEINPLSQQAKSLSSSSGAGRGGFSTMAANDQPGFRDRLQAIRRNITVDGANYISLRAFLGRRAAGRPALLYGDEEDAASPSVETFLEKRQGRTTAKEQQEGGGSKGRGLRSAAAEIDAQGEAVRRLNVYGTDQRSWFDWDAYPDRVFGKLMFPKAYFCTGQLIGRYHVLTAAHCFFTYGNQIDGDNMYRSVFRVGYHTDQVTGQHYYANASTWNKLWYGTTYPEVYRNSDWAIIQLDEPLGDTQGFVGINPANLRSELPILNKFELIGYSEDGYSQTAGKDPRCSLEGYSQGVYFHNCDCAAGASGGALLDPANNVVGINTAHIMPRDASVLRGSDFNSAYPNIAVPAAQFMPTFAHILTQMADQ